MLPALASFVYISLTLLPALYVLHVLLVIRHTSDMPSMRQAALTVSVLYLPSLGVNLFAAEYALAGIQAFAATGALTIGLLWNRCGRTTRPGAADATTDASDPYTK
ncbi:hypothetical protein OG728_39435 (plasmid) [Streptomyces microflavus]|uniref:hypothetical protein n=1 Tax=Streptomyces microflavus TaxID=1919 RepID=UPI002E144B8E|nr:hypothetical protein OG728_39435 [Streptomyces microflavus]